MQCVEGCRLGEQRLDFEQPVRPNRRDASKLMSRSGRLSSESTIDRESDDSMFVGEFLCCVPLLWSHFSRSSKGDPSVASLLNKIGLGKSSDEGYSRIAQTEGDEAEDVEGLELDNALTGWRMMWMWFPAFFDSE
jgi:hypothetical protein